MEKVGDGTYKWKQQDKTKTKNDKQQICDVFSFLREHWQYALEKCVYWTAVE